MVYTDEPEHRRRADAEDPAAAAAASSRRRPDGGDDDDETERLSSSFDTVPLADGDDDDDEATWGIGRTCLALFLGACMFVALMRVGMEAGASIRDHGLLGDPARGDDESRGTAAGGGVPRGRSRAEASSLTESSALDVLNKDNPTSTFNLDFVEDLSPNDKMLLQYLLGSSYARGRAMELMIDEYTSKEGSDTEFSDKLDNAIEVMQLSETDGEPVQIRGYPFLFVGSAGATMNHEALKRSGITHVISWSKTAKCDHFPDIAYLCIKDVVNYKDMMNHIDELDRAVDYVESARRAGGRAMSQCWYGRNRSVTLLVAYLMKYEGMDSEEALRLIRETRPIADSYRDVLYYYGKRYANNHKRAKARKGTDAD